MTPQEHVEAGERYLDAAERDGVNWHMQCRIAELHFQAAAITAGLPMIDNATKMGDKVLEEDWT